MSLEERTIPGLHEAAEKLLARFAGSDASVVDLGAGSGAWAARLRARGFQVLAVDRDPSGFELEGVECLERDLDRDFADTMPGPFDLVTAIELIEHLENPRHFLRECRRLLRPSGRLLLTTPNVESVPGRIRFLLFGDLRMFGRDPRFNDPTHITPIHSLMFERMVRDAGLVVLRHEFNGPPTITRAAGKIVSRLLEPILRGAKGGDCHLFVLAPN